jgi:hypothetical protein
MWKIIMKIVDAVKQINIKSSVDVLLMSWIKFRKTRIKFINGYVDYQNEISDLISKFIIL